MKYFIAFILALVASGVHIAHATDYHALHNTMGIDKASITHTVDGQRIVTHVTAWNKMLGTDTYMITNVAYVCTEHIYKRDIVGYIDDKGNMTYEHDAMKLDKSDWYYVRAGSYNEDRFNAVCNS